MIVSVLNLSLKKPYTFSCISAIPITHAQAGLLEVKGDVVPAKLFQLLQLSPPCIRQGQPTLRHKSNSSQVQAGHPVDHPRQDSNDNFLSMSLRFCGCLLYSITVEVNHGYRVVVIRQMGRILYDTLRNLNLCL